MRVRLQVTGRSPLVLHNIRLADPDDAIVKQIAAITSKRKKTADDRAEIARLEWFGGLYLGTDGEPCLPTSHFRKSLVRAGSINRLGKSVERGVIMTSIEVPLEYSGPRKIEDLWEQPQHRYRTAVTVQRARVMRMRPIFPQWSATAELELLTDVLDLDTFQSIADLAGLAEGVGTNRVGGYGRYEAKVLAA